MKEVEPWNGGTTTQHPGLTDKATDEKPGSRFPDYRPDMPPRPSVLAIYRDDGGKVGA